MNLREFTESKVYKNLTSKLYGWGASVVILGALFKINHYPGASYLLLIGLSCEALIFFVSAFEPLLEHYDWSLVYPELAGIGPDNEIEKSAREPKITTEEITSLILEKANIQPEVLSQLGEGFSRLSKSASTIADVSDASAVTVEYTKNLKAASDSAKVMAQTTDSYKELSENITTNAEALTSGSEAYFKHLDKLNNNLTALNSVYEIQLQGTNDYVKSSRQINEGFDKMLGSLQDSVQNTQKYKDEMSKLGSKIEALNQVYGNMLSALNYNKQ